MNSLRVATGKVIRRLFIIDLHTQQYMAIGEANGSSSTFTIKQLSASETDCVGTLCRNQADNVSLFS